MIEIELIYGAVNFDNLDLVIKYNYTVAMFNLCTLQYVERYIDRNKFDDTEGGVDTFDSEMCKILISYIVFFRRTMILRLPLCTIK